MGDAFRNQPTYGDNPTARNRGQPSNHEGHYWIGSFENRPTPQSKPGKVVGDRPQGTLRSRIFLITGPSIEFLVGGGCHIDTVRVELVVADKVVRRATGKCTETMERKHWDTTSFIGNKAYVKLIDRSSGAWGHINFDDFGGDIEFCEGIWISYAYSGALTNSFFVMNLRTCDLINYTSLNVYLSIRACSSLQDFVF